MLCFKKYATLQAKALTFGSALMLAQLAFGALGISFVRLNLIKIMPKVF